MKMVSAAKLRRAQERIFKARPYAYKLREVIAEASTHINPEMHPLLAIRPPKKAAYLIVTADRGLCGGFNNNIIQQAIKVISEHTYESYSLFCAGKKGYDFFKRREYPIMDKYINFFNTLDYHNAQQITDRIIELYLKEELDAVIMIYNEFKSAIQQRIITERLLPLEPDPALRDKKRNEIEYIFEPEPLRILDTVIPLHIGIQVWRVLLESSAAEHGARMTAMENATDSAQDMITSLTMRYNSVRQATITKELTEIVAGADALK
jgi:F-type H+-transporting ATPase subunit gamma